MADAMAPGGIAVNLDDDVLSEILLRLPPKSVLRAGAVSRHWRHIATRPCFLAAYSLRRPPEIIVHYSEVSDESTATIRNDNKHAVGAINFTAAEDDLERRPLLHYNVATLLFLDMWCNGLLLLHRPDERLLIWNPATRQAVLLPSPPITSPHDSAVWPFGFFCHRASGEYRVLCHVEQIHYILSAGGGEPRRLEEDNIALPTFPGVALHGSLHWLIRPPDSKEPDMMMAFDTVSDKFRRMAAPMVPAAGSSSYRAPHLFEMNGLLAVSAVRDVPHMDVWVLQDYNRQSWAWRLRITIPQAPRMYSLPFTASALGVLDGNLLVAQYGGVVILYDMVGKKRVSTIDIRAGDISAVCRQGIFRESLVSLPSTAA